MHIARDDILNSARTKGGGHLLLKTKLKAGGTKMIRVGEKDAPFQSFAQS